MPNKAQTWASVRFNCLRSVSATTMCGRFVWEGAMARRAWFRAFMALAASTSVCAAAEPVTLRFSLQVATDNPQLGVSVVQFKEEVERETQKSLLVEIYDKGRLYIDDQVLGAVQSGAVEMGMAG